MRADRLLSIILLLQQHGRMTAKALARRLEASERTIYRDIDALGAMGVPVSAEAGTGGGFSLPANYRTRLDGLNAPEIHALFLQMNEGPFKQLGIGDHMRSALLKLLGGLSERNREDADWIRERVYLDMESWRREPGHEDKLRTIRQAVWEQRRAEVAYTDRRRSARTFELDGYGLVLKAGMWFVVGRTSGAVRAFRLAHIHAAELTEETFERPADFRLEAFWADWLAAYEHRQFPYRVTARIRPEALGRVAQFGGVVLERTAGEDERARAELGFESEAAAASALLALAGVAEAESPASLRERLRAEAGRLRAMYEREPEGP